MVVRVCTIEKIDLLTACTKRAKLNFLEQELLT